MAFSWLSILGPMPLRRCNSSFVRVARAFVFGFAGAARLAFEAADVFGAAAFDFAGVALLAFAVVAFFAGAEAVFFGAGRDLPLVVVLAFGLAPALETNLAGCAAVLLDEPADLVSRGG
ncbi:MAG: hypothetical protein GY948_08000 [Alphaproteobacteria bacterium]|nr:hypothetical protein [Alphaproteobacteria bacterium]